LKEILSDCLFWSSNSCLYLIYFTMYEMGTCVIQDEPTYDNVATLKYMDMFIDEVLRRYPPLVR